jgi:hypothetical protein
MCICIKCRITIILSWSYSIRLRAVDSSVGIALGYRLEVRGSRVRFPAGLGIFLFTTASRTALGPTQPPIQWVPGALSLGVRRPGREADHPHLVPRSKNEWSYISIPHYAFMAWSSAKAQGQIYLYLHSVRLSASVSTFTLSSSVVFWQGVRVVF